MVNGNEFASGHSLDSRDWIDLISEVFNKDVEIENISDEEMEIRS